MKQLLLISIALVLLGCKSDDDTANEITLDSSWTLISYTPSPILPHTITYEPGQIIWKFDTQANTIDVVLTAGGDILLEPVTYNYELTDNSCNYNDNKYIQIVDGQRLGVLILDDLQDGEITISEACVDGFIAVFEQISTEI